MGWVTVSSLKPLVRPLKEAWNAPTQKQILTFQLLIFRVYVSFREGTLPGFSVTIGMAVVWLEKSHLILDGKITRKEPTYFHGWSTYPPLTYPPQK